MPDSEPLESVWVSAAWRGGQHTVVGVVYRPPASPVTAGLDAIHSLLIQTSSTGKPIFLLGDMNFADTLDKDSYTNSRRYIRNSAVLEQPKRLKRQWTISTAISPPSVPKLLPSCARRSRTA